jgi:gluconokinase
MFNIHQLQWDSTALEFAGITKDKLSTPVSVFERFENIEEKMRQRLGLQQTIPLVIGSSDGCLANIGSGVTVGEGIAVTISTSMAVRITTRAPYHDAAASLFNYALEPTTFVCGGGSNNGSLLLNWMAENILQDDALKDPERFMKKALSVPAGCDGLVFLPYLLGERAPVWDADASGVITGFKFHHRQAHLMRALIEGLTMNVCIVVERLLQVDGNSRIIKASGGFTNSVAWVQMLADISNLPVLVDDIADASAIGAVMVAGYSLGVFTTLTKPVNTAKNTSVYYPRPQEHLKYMDNYAVFKTLYAKNLRA